MALKELNLQTCYETTEDQNDLLDKFYIPILENAKKYFRIAGFFSSSSLSVAAKGIEGLVKNNGKMYLLISPELSNEDYNVISKHGTLLDNLDMFKELDIEKMPSDHIKLLAWLLDNDRLEIKIVVPKRSNSSLFHQKIGIILDENDDMVSFSGSINESAQAWLNNIEEFKVFCSWIDGQREYLNADLTKFLSYWKNEKQEIAMVYDVPESIKYRLIKQKPRDVWDLNIMRKYHKDKKNENNNLKLFEHQKAAIKEWISNGYSLLMEMATGTGKTRTAIGCILEKIKDKEQLLIIVSTPQGTLSRQWKNDIDSLGIVFDKAEIIDGSNKKWKKDLELILLDLSDKRYSNAIIFTTHALASQDTFINIIKETKYNSKILYIADEVHATGSEKQKKALLDEYDYRIGLSATPERMFDDVGTSIIRSYFGSKSYEFTIEHALSTINPLTQKPFLNSYKYYPIFVELTPSETKNYMKLSQQIVITKSQEDYDQELLQRLYDKRANISKNAKNKFLNFSELMEEIGPMNIQETLLFVSDKQIEKCFDILAEMKIKRAKITEAESASKIVNNDGETERQELISLFVKKQLQVLVGMKCLDEGIDIPNARIAILLSNSTNPREYIQRVGRVIRQAPNKEESIIYDFITYSNEPGMIGLLEKEAKRANYIAKNSANYADTISLFQEKGVELDAN